MMNPGTIWTNINSIVIFSPNYKSKLFSIIPLYVIHRFWQKESGWSVWIFPVDAFRVRGRAWIYSSCIKLTIFNEKAQVWQPTRQVAKNICIQSATSKACCEKQNWSKDQIIPWFTDLISQSTLSDTPMRLLGFSFKTTNLTLWP